MSARDLISAQEISEVYGLSVSRLSELTRDGVEAFEVVETRDRRHYRDRAKVAAWAAQREQSARQAGEDLLRGRDPDELLTPPQIARLLGVKSAATIHNYINAGVFGEPDEVESLPAGGVRKKYKLSTIAAAQAKRPGRGNKQPAPPRRVPPPPPTDAGDPDRLVPSSEVARLLGYTSTASFASAYSQGLLPELGDPEPQDEAAAVGRTRGRPARRWRLGKVLEVAKIQRAQQ